MSKIIEIVNTGIPIKDAEYLLHWILRRATESKSYEVKAELLDIAEALARLISISKLVKE